MSSAGNTNQEAPFRWQQATEMDNFFHCPNVGSKDVFYARTYTPGAGYSHSQTNQAIINLKKTVSAPAGELYWKNQAIRQFCEELKLFLGSAKFKQEQILIVPMPPSKTKQHAEYDDRIERVAKCVELGLTHCKTFPVLIGTKDMDQSSQSTASRDVQKFHEAMGIDETAVGPFTQEKRIIVLDDVTTSGAHFEAARQHLLERFPDCKISGIFWAKSKELSATEVFPAIS